MLKDFFGNLIFAIIVRMLCGNHLNIFTRNIESAQLYQVLRVTALIDIPAHEGEGLLLIVL